MPKIAYERIVALGEVRVAEIKERLYNGETPIQIAGLIRNEWGECADIKVESLKKTIDRYRRDVVRPERMNEIVAAVGRKYTTGLGKRIDAMNELEALAVVQRQRFQDVFNREQEMGKGGAKGMLLKTVSEEGKLLKDMLVELGRLQLETGVLRRAPKTVNGQVIDEEGNVRTFSWTEEADRLMQVIEDAGYSHVD